MVLRGPSFGVFGAALVGSVVAVAVALPWLSVWLRLLLWLL
jgi:hypothetical protein